MNRRRQNRKSSPGSWQPTVPSWEKKFCSEVGKIPWPKVLEAKKLMYLFEDVLNWRDSAGEEAFNNAKNRFWAEINGLPCDISLPDPDIYIDQIDWSSDINPELVLELDRETLASDNEEEDIEEMCRLIDGTVFIGNQPIPCSGWGDEDEDHPVTSVSELDRETLASDNKEDDVEVMCRLIDGTVFFGNQPIPCSGWGDEDEDHPVRTVAEEEASRRPGFGIFYHNTNGAYNPRCNWENSEHGRNGNGWNRDGGRPKYGFHRHSCRPFCQPGSRKTGYPLRWQKHVC